MKRRNSCGGLRRCLLLSILLVLSLPLSARGIGEKNTTLRSPRRRNRQQIFHHLDRRRRG
jgi:hypothetical protein